MPDNQQDHPDQARHPHGAQNDSAMTQGNPDPEFLILLSTTKPDACLAKPIAATKGRVPAGKSRSGTRPTKH